jgi:hypothetical protein
MIPRVVFRLELPEPLADGRACERMNAAAVRFALRAELELHHAKRIPQHFTTAARTKYQHMERRPSTKAKKIKVFRSRTDLVASGMTKKEMLTNKRIAIAGSVAAGGVVGTLRMKFPFPASFTRSPNRVSLAQMAKEIATITRDEAQELSASFARRHAEHQQAALARSPRIRKRLGL